MPSIGDLKQMFGRTYVFANPNQSLGPGMWLLSDADDANQAGTIPENTLPIYGQAHVSSTSVPILRGMLVCINVSGEAYAAIATSTESSRVVGVAIDTANLGQVVRYTQNTVMDIFNPQDIVDEGSTTFEVGREYYLSATNAGFWTRVPDTSSNDFVTLQCGTAASTNAMAIDIEPPIRIVDGGIYAN